MQIDQPVPKNQQLYSFMDCHTHLLDYPTQQQTQNVIQNALKQNVNKIVVNTTTTKQFVPLLALLQKYPNTIIGAFGIHPYFLDQQQKIQVEKRNMQVAGGNGQDRKSWLEQLQIILSKKNQYSVGQIGLDFRKTVLQNNPKQLQMHYFKSQLNLAIRMQRPATIHCVRAHGQMLKILKQLNKNIKQQPKPNLIMHSYGGSEDITKSMIKLNNINIYFSLCLKRNAELCSVIPLERLIFQTDSPCQNNIKLLQQYNRLDYNTYHNRTIQQMKQLHTSKTQQIQQMQQNNNITKIITKQQKQIQKQTQLFKDKQLQIQTQTQIQKLQTNQPINVITNIKSIMKYYGMQQHKFMKIIYQNSLRAFKLFK